MLYIYKYISSCNAGDLGLIPGSGRSPREGNENPFQYSCLEKSLVVYCPWGRKELDMTERLTLLLFKNIFIKETYICQDIFSYAKKKKILNNSNVVKTLTSVFISSVQFSSVAQLCLTLCDPMNRSTPGLPVHHQLLESTQTHVHWVGDAIQPSHPLSSPSPSALNLSQHQGLF